MEKIQFNIRCPWCKTVFETTRRNKDYCSDVCKLAHWYDINRGEKKKKIIKTRFCALPTCNVEFTVKNRGQIYHCKECEKKHARMLTKVTVFLSELCPTCAEAVDVNTRS